MRRFGIAAALFLGLLACGLTAQAASAKDKKDLKLGCLAYSEPMVQWIKEALEPQGYTVKVLMFDANQLPATALKDGDLDGIIANHRPWILTFNRENGCSLDMVKPYYFHSYFAIYSTKIKSLQALPQNAKIAVPGDPTNLSRSLIILREAGLVTLGEKSGIFYTIMDITKNPKTIGLIETEITQTARSINDVDAIISTAYFVGEAAKDYPSTVLFEDPQNKEYALGLIVRSQDLEAEWARKAMEALRSEKCRTKFNEHFKGKYTLYP